MTPVRIIIGLALLSALAFARDEMPGSVQICTDADTCVTYYVHVTHKQMGWDLMAKVTYFQHYILISSYHASRQDLASDLIHESMHAMLYESGLQHQDEKQFSEHDVIYQFDELLPLFLAKNPAAVKYIQHSY